MKTEIIDHSILETPNLPSPNRFLTFAVLAIWAITIVTLAVGGIYSGAPEDPPLAILISVFLPILIFVLGYVASQTFRETVLAWDETSLILLHSWRMIGLGFVFLFFHGKLPGLFALPAGLGDAATAIGAYFLGIALIRNGLVARWKKQVWNFFGFLDFVVALVFGVITRTMWNGGISSEAMGEFPLAIIPGFAVPFFMITHLVLFLKWRDESQRNGRLKRVQ